MTTPGGANGKRPTLPEYPTKKAQLLAEARGQFEYFHYKRTALSRALKLIQEDLKLCEDNEQVWQKRIEAMTKK